MNTELVTADLKKHIYIHILAVAAGEMLMIRTAVSFRPTEILTCSSMTKVYIFNNPKNLFTFLERQKLNI